jgi:hypothetical protein
MLYNIPNNAIEISLSPALSIPCSSADIDLSMRALRRSRTSTEESSMPAVCTCVHVCVCAHLCVYVCIYACVCKSDTTNCDRQCIVIAFANETGEDIGRG